MLIEVLKIFCIIRTPENLTKTFAQVNYEPIQCPSLFFHSFNFHEKNILYR